MKESRVLSAAAREFCESYRNNYAAVLSYCRRRCDSETAEDLCAEVFVRAWRGWPPRGKHLPWLYGIAHNVVLEFYRERTHENDKVVSLAQQPSSAHVTRSAEEVVVTQGTIVDALHSLSEEDQEVLRLHTWEACSVEDIADVLCVRVGTVRVRLHRARRRLRDILRSGTVPITEPSGRGSQPSTASGVVTGKGAQYHRKARGYE